MRNNPEDNKLLHQKRLYIRKMSCTYVVMCELCTIIATTYCILQYFVVILLRKHDAEDKKLLAKRK